MELLAKLTDGTPVKLTLEGSPRTRTGDIIELGDSFDHWLIVKIEPGEKPLKMEKIQKLQNNIFEWSNKTFSTQKTPIPILKHLIKEIEKELIPALKKHYENKKHGTSPTIAGPDLLHVYHEFADVQILLLDAQAHISLSIEQLMTFMYQKMEINKARKWKAPDGDGICEHIEEKIEK